MSLNKFNRAEPKKPELYSDPAKVLDLMLKKTDEHIDYRIPRPFEARIKPGTLNENHLEQMSDIPIELSMIMSEQDGIVMATGSKMDAGYDWGDLSESEKFKLGYRAEGGLIKGVSKWRRRWKYILHTHGDDDSRESVGDIIGAYLLRSDVYIVVSQRHVNIFGFRQKSAATAYRMFKFLRKHGSLTNDIPDEDDPIYKDVFTVTFPLSDPRTKPLLELLNGQKKWQQVKKSIQSDL